MSESSSALDRGVPRQLPRADHPLVLLLVLALIAAFLFGTVPRGQDWSGDAALYIMNARNIALGLPYGRTDYVPNPANPIYPAAYPPGLPLLLAPIYRASGIDLGAMKALCVACLVLLLAVFWRIARDALAPAPALLTAAAFGLHPFVWYCGRYIASEFPFMLFCYCGLYVLDRLQRPHLPARRLAPIGIAAVALALACITRTIGFVAFPAAVLAALPDRRRLAATLAALAAAGVLILGTHLAFPADLGTYMSYLHSFGLHSMRSGIRHYLAVRADLIGKAAVNVPILGRVLWVALIAACGLGLLVRARSRVSVYEWFFLGYGGFLLLYPISDEANRYSLPLWPLVFLYCAVGIGALGQLLGRGARSWAAAAVITLIAGLYVAHYAALDWGPTPYSMDAPESRALYAAIRTDVPPRAMVLAPRPTVVALYAERRAIVWPAHVSDRELWDFMALHHIDYLMQDIHLPGGRSGPPNEFDLFIARNRASLKLLFSNRWFHLYRVVAAASAS
ncbi:MAG: hypothetical protein ACREUT_08055 [Steroidobacteraceae bacterium]